MVKRPFISVVDDESVRESLPDPLGELGFSAKAFSSAEEFLASDCIGQIRCLILDVTMPGMSGPDLQQELSRRRQEIPIVFITAHREENVRPRLLERGAVECRHVRPSTANVIWSASCLRPGAGQNRLRGEGDTDVRRSMKTLPPVNLSYETARTPAAARGMA